LANADEYSNAIALGKSIGYGSLTSTQKALVDKAAKQAGSIGNAARQAQSKS